jgi:hypothetical protein
VDEPVRRHVVVQLEIVGLAVTRAPDVASTMRDIKCWFNEEKKEKKEKKKIANKCQICQIAKTPATHRFSVTRIVPRLPFQRLPTLRKLIATTVMSELVVHASLMARSAARLLNVCGGGEEKKKKKNLIF